MTPLVEYTLRIADNCLILGHRVSEWCGHGPMLEQDIAMTNLALDLVGQARTLYAYAGTLFDPPKTEDDLAYLRDVFQYRNLLLVEQPNGDFAQTILRHFLFSAFQLPFYEALTRSTDETLRGVAAKGVKEMAYHRRWSSEWVVRLGDGTDESRRRMEAALAALWPYNEEALLPDALDAWAADSGVGVDLASIRPAYEAVLSQTFAEATLPMPRKAFAQTGGKVGTHTEYLGYLLAEMQFMQRAYPHNVW